MGGGGGGSISGADIKKLEEKARKSLRGVKASAPHVFISFAFEDEDLVNLLRGQAKNDKVGLEFDDFSLREALNSQNEDYIKRKIRERIDRASVTLVYLTGNSATSKWVKWEIEESLRRGKGVIGVYKGDQPPNQLPEPFGEHNFKLVRWSHQGLTDAIEGARKDR